MSSNIGIFTETETDGTVSCGNGGSGIIFEKEDGYYYVLTAAHVTDLHRQPGACMKRLKYGNTNTYFIDGLLFDTDMPGTLPLFYRAIKQSGIPFGSIRCVMASHYHPDHMGLISELADMGITHVIVQHQLEHVHFADGILRREYGDRYRPIDESRATVISVEESREFLSSIGISGEIIPTCSHSADGIALLLDDGECFAGDLEPLSYIGGYENNTALEKDWKAILLHSPKTVHFGHVNDHSF